MPQSTTGCHRPKPIERRIQCAAIERLLTETAAKIHDSELQTLWLNCFPNTLDTSANILRCAEHSDAFIITGDIEAMWLRDAPAQIHPYLPCLQNSETIQQLFIGTLNRIMSSIELDPYANAFYSTPEAVGEWASDLTDMKPGVHERKWELDSLAYFLRLSSDIYESLGGHDCFNRHWLKTVERILEIFRKQQDYPNEYRFSRQTSIASETLWLNGQGTPSKACGLIRSAFRPSDDACTLPFHIPANAMTATMLERVSHICDHHYQAKALAESCRQMSSTIHSAIRTHGIVQHAKHGEVYAYEVDGYGGHLLMDDANVPSLLALPYLGFCTTDDPTYQNTRALILSEDNPYFFQHEGIEGIGSPHTGLGQIWPMSIIIRAITSTDSKEINHCLSQLKHTHANTGFMHESFSAEDANTFTRGWFCWANGLFGELIYHLSQHHPECLQASFN